MNEIDVIDRNDPEYTALLDNVGNAIEAGKGKAVAAINSPSKLYQIIVVKVLPTAHHSVTL